MRFTSELHDTEMDLHSMARQVLESPTWVPESKRMTLKKYLVEQVTKTNGELLPDNNIEAVNTKTNRLKWMLDHTMGSGGDFERRRSELVLRQEVGDMNNVMDENVVKSYVDSVKEGGVLRDFLLHGNLAFVAHQTLFVHGGIINGDDGAGLSALGRVPDEPSKHFDSVLEWVDKLNAWYRSQIQDWIDYPHWNAKHSSRGGNELLKYVVPNYAGSVVVGRHLLAGGMPTPLPDKTASLLSKSGIRRVIIGHTPHGNCPTVIKQPQGQINTCPMIYKPETIAEALHRR
uniref:Calcineurin-like phosphoesterase domain-containing protein n=1 Tax=Hyaloperonospora arabidopsidis (strain Emoy2) TaxID=559515 RepID=M4BWE1_HYAAE